MPGLTHFPSCGECGKQNGHRETCSRSKSPYQRLEEENNEQRAMINSLDAEVGRLTDRLPRWIPVTERMPELQPIYGNGVELIVCLDDGTVQTSPKYCGLGFADIRGPRERRVTHWMPLPAPPVAESV